MDLVHLVHSTVTMTGRNLCCSNVFLAHLDMWLMQLEVCPTCNACVRFDWCFLELLFLQYLRFLPFCLFGCFYLQYQHIVLLVVMWIQMETAHNALMEHFNPRLHRWYVENSSGKSKAKRTSSKTLFHWCKFPCSFQPSCFPCPEGGTTGGPGAVSVDSCGELPVYIRCRLSLW